MGGIWNDKSMQVKRDSCSGGEGVKSACDDAALMGTSELMCYENGVTVDDADHVQPHHDAHFSSFVNS